MWTLIDKISGMKFESHLRYELNKIWFDLIEDYKQQGIKTFVTYQGNGVYWLDEYVVGYKGQYKEVN